VKNIIILLCIYEKGQTYEKHEKQILIGRKLIIVCSNEKKKKKDMYVINEWLIISEDNIND